MKIAAALSLAVLPFACHAAPPLDKDGVPKVDLHGTIITVEMPNEKARREYGLPPVQRRMIDVDGNKMPLTQFMLTYCQGKIGNETCARASTIAGLDSASGPKKVLPAGL